MEKNWIFKIEMRFHKSWSTGFGCTSCTTFLYLIDKQDTYLLNSYYINCFRLRFLKFLLLKIWGKIKKNYFLVLIIFCKGAETFIKFQFFLNMKQKLYFRLEHFLQGSRNFYLISILSDQEIKIFLRIRSFFWKNIFAAIFFIIF
jgi:hypothetical protein